jgi:hypothetical protein
MSDTAVVVRWERNIRGMAGRVADAPEAVMASIGRVLQLPPSGTPVTSAEIGGVTGLFVVLGAAVFGDYVLHGGFHSDDWSIAAAYHLAGRHAYASVVSQLTDINGGRPLLSLIAPLPHVIFGLHARLHLADAIALGVLASVSFYVLLRVLGLARSHAASMATLAFLFPWSDGVRFWATAGVTNAALVFFFLGSILAVRGMSERGRRAAGIHAGAVALYLASALTYEVAAGAVALSGVLYLTQAPWSRVRLRWLVDAALVTGAIAWSSVATKAVRYVPSIPYKLKVAPQDTCEAVSVFASSWLPRTAATPVAQVLTIAAIAAAVLGLRRRWAPRQSARPWRSLAVVGLTWLVGGYAITLGSLHPLDAGANNRGNMFAAFGFSLVVYAVGMLVVVGLLSDRQPLAIVAMAFTVLVSLAYVMRIEHDKRLWLDAQRRQRDVLAAIRSVGRPEHGTAIYAFGFPAHVATAVPVFAYSWDLNGAVQLMWKDSSLSAYPIHSRLTLACERGGVSPSGFGLGRDNAAAYPNALLVDVGRRLAYRPKGQADCRVAVRRLRRGPWELSDTRESCPLGPAVRALTAAKARPASRAAHAGQLA